MPYFNAGVYLANKTQVGRVEEIFGPTTDVMFTVKCGDGVVAIGGTCDSVGAVGCWLAGCYGTMSKIYGAATMNLLEARVVLANGSLVALSQCSHPDLFWSLRGGGGGNIGVVTEYTARSHPAPELITTVSFSGSVTTLDEYGPFMEECLRVYADAIPEVNASTNGGSGISRNYYNSNEAGGSSSSASNTITAHSKYHNNNNNNNRNNVANNSNPNSAGAQYVYSFSLMLQGLGDTAVRQRELLQPLMDYVVAQQVRASY